MRPFPQAGSQVRPALGDGEVHVWKVTLSDISPDLLQVLERSLSDDEVERAGRYVFQHDRDSFVAARGMLRRTLAGYLGLEPASVSFVYDRHGKPHLSPETGSHGIRFNLSHSGDLALIAVVCNREVGIDIERHRFGLDIEGIARSTFSPAEVETFLALSHAERSAGFFNCWSRKEAYIKARGEGLSYPLTAFDVSLRPGTPAALLRSDEGVHEVVRWAFVDLDIEAGYAATLVVEHPVRAPAMFSANVEPG